MGIRHVASRLLLIPLTVVAGGLIGATFARLAPGFGTDERELESGRSEASLQALRRSSAAGSDLPAFYKNYLIGLLHGDLGFSRSLARPVRELLAERAPLTLRGAGVGLMCGWLLGLALAGPAAFCRAPFFDVLGSTLSGAFLCLPAALLALLLLLAGGPGWLAICFVVFPRVFRYTRNLLIASSELPHVLMARAKGAGRARILFRHVTPPAMPQILALAGVTVSTALGAAIPMEVLCDIPGAGQLAWQAAMARDLPLLVNLTALTTAVTLTANFASDLAIGAWRRSRTA
jgi:peptide/nickel transport system permease protein